ncbi:MAG: hypothetical protein ACUVTX_09730 [Bacteroidales bacterium]
MKKLRNNMPLQMRNLLLTATFVIFAVTGIKSQENSSPFSVKGYLTTLQSAMFDSLSGPVSYNNLIHNRLNLRAYIYKSISLGIEIRNRLFTGDLPRTGNYYSDIIGEDYGWIDLSWNVVKENSFFLNTTLDRLWIDFRFGKFEICAGRQRINWGQTFVWNPNDIYNAYSFFDFDYVERPGSDAVRFQYYSGASSVFEFAVKADSEDDITAAALYRFNKWGYDIQFLGGYSNSADIVVGAGWSGSAGSFSLRGETTWFYPANAGRKGTVIFTTGLDKIFEKNSTLQVQLMYCNNPLDFTDFNSFYSGNLSAKDLAFSEFTAFGSYIWAVTPLLNTGISVMWFPDLKGYFAGPSLDYSVAENIDFSVIWQHFNAIMSGTKTRLNLAFLRVKYSF